MSRPDAPSPAPAPQGPPGRLGDESETPTPRRGSRYLAAGITALLMALILGWLLFRERDALATINVQHAWPRLVAGQVLMLIGLIGAAWVWGSIMRAVGSRLAMVDHFHIYASTYLSRFLPGTIWYVVGRSAFYRIEGETARSVTVGSAIELLLSTVAGALLAFALGILVATQTPAATLPVLALAVAAGILAFNPRVLALLVRRLRLPAVPPLPMGSLARWLLVDILAWLIGAVIFWLIANEVGSVPLAAIGYTTFAWTLMGSLVIFVFFLPSNFGLTEVGLTLLLSTIMPSSLAVVVAVLTRILQTLFAVVACGLIVAVTTHRRRAARP